MVFQETLPLDPMALLRSMGLPGDLDTKEAEPVLQAAERVEQAASPRWASRCFTLLPGLELETTGLRLPGNSIAAHLDGCHSCILLAVTLGAGIEQAIRAAQAEDMTLAFWIDAAASRLAEQYAGLANRLLRKSAEQQHSFLTSRFSPGYGDLPLSLQQELVELLDARLAIGLSVSHSGILLPRKSITAIVGVADHPVTGRQAGCDECGLRQQCKNGRGGTKLCEN